MVKLKTIPRLVKISGIIICMLGVATIAFCRGPHLKLMLHHHLFRNYTQQHQVFVPSSKTWAKGVFLMLISNTCWGLWLVLQGVMVTGVTFYLQAWVIEKKGPVFLAISMPLALIFTIISSALLLGEIISLGSVFGGILLVAGLCCVLWGKSKEQKMDVNLK